MMTMNTTTSSRASPRTTATSAAARLQVATLAFWRLRRAAASVGAVWSLCSPEMGTAAVVDRFRQIEPKVLIAVDGYRWSGRAHDRREIVASLLQALPSVERLVLVPYLDAAADAQARSPDL